jgi:hypothetical protein
VDRFKYWFDDHVEPVSKSARKSAFIYGVLHVVAVYALVNLIGR